MEVLATQVITNMDIELERTFLAKKLPDLTDAERVEMIDIYLPSGSRHPTLRIRKSGQKYQITRKEPQKDDPSVMLEETVHITKEVFDELEKSVKGKRVHKTRYFKDGFEIDVLQDKLKSLVLVDIEFDSEYAKDEFEMPDFCLADVTHEEFIAGGMLCGKSYEDIEEELEKFGYDKL